MLFTYLGDPGNYHCAAAYVKAMGLNLIERSSGMYQGKLKISKRGSSAGALLDVSGGASPGEKELSGASMVFEEEASRFG